ncbi:MAG: response regulator transcription factor [Anaerolineae bacterium]
MRTILVIESDEFIRGVVAKTLTEAGYQVLTAAAEGDGLQALEEAAVDGLVVGHADGAVDSVPILKWVRADKQRAATPVCAITMRATDIPKLTAAGANEVITGPFTVEELLHVMAGLFPNPVL